MSKINLKGSSTYICGNIKGLQVDALGLTGRARIFNIERPIKSFKLMVKHLVAWDSSDSNSFESSPTKSLKSRMGTL